MKDIKNTVFGWLLAGGIAALGLSIGSQKLIYHSEAPEKEGFAIEAAEAEGGGDTGPSFNTLLASADVAKGEKVFAKCVACHTINSGGAAGVGPNLYGIVGNKHGHQGGFAYSSAISGIAGPWTFDALNEWLANPKKYAPGTKMSFAGLSKGEDRANLIAYMNTQGSNVPLPAADAPATEEANPEGEAAPAAEEGAADAAAEAAAAAPAQ